MNARYSPLVVLGRDRFRIPADEATRIADQLIYRVLMTCTIEEPGDRALKRADLYHAIDSASRVSMPRASLDAFVGLLSGSATTETERAKSAKPLSDTTQVWLIDGRTIPRVPGTIARVSVESALSNALSDYGAAVLVGGNGLGKSIVSHSVADTLSLDCTVAQFRYANEADTRHRLDTLFGHIAALRWSLVVLDDLRYIAHRAVSPSVARIIDSIRRHDCKLIITCSRQPSVSVLSTLDLNPDAVIDCPYFTQHETRALVERHDGDAHTWGHFAHVAGAHGHPQLTYAFVVGAATRGWPARETEDILAHGLFSDDVVAARDTARQELIYSLPQPTRNLLYRLSLTSGPFTRSIALAIGTVGPSVSRTGERFDQLVGPWIEALGQNRYRVSPLASTFGSDMLSAKERRLVHMSIARDTLAGRTIDADMADSVLMHAVLGKCPNSLRMLAYSLLSADSTELAKLADHFPLFQSYRTDVPIYPENLSVSGLLRIAQFKLTVAAGRGETIPNLGKSLFREILQIPDTRSRHEVEIMALLSVLSTVGIASHIENWLAHVLRCIDRMHMNVHFRDNLTTMERASGIPLYAGLFSIGVANLASVETLERIIDDLNDLDPDLRAQVLAPINPAFADYSDIIGSPWIAQHSTGKFDATDAATRYQRMTQKTLSWGNRALSVQCALAQSIILDEHLGDHDGALTVLRTAAKRIGPHPILGRGIANVHRRHGDETKALAVFRGIADTVGDDNPIERAFTLRMAAICATECRDWSQATKWFRDAQAVAGVIDTDKMKAMAVGLCADSAIAALEAGDPAVALSRLAESIEVLPKLDPERTLSEAYCHRVVRHTVLCVESRLAGIGLKIKGQPLVLKAGTCSNPDPPEAIRELPLGDLDLAWYMLAKAEVAANVDVGISATLGDRLARGPIRAMELDLRAKIMQKAIDALDASAFADHFAEYVEISAHFLEDPNELREFDPMVPKRGTPRRLKTDESEDARRFEKGAKDPILSFVIRSSMANRPQSIEKLKAAMQRSLGDRVASGPTLILNDSTGHSLTELDSVVLHNARAILRGDYISPERIWIAGLRILEWSKGSEFGGILVSALSGWMRSEWSRIVEAEGFRLVRPWKTVPVVMDTLGISKNDRSFAAKLLLATAEAAGVLLSSGYRTNLEEMAARG